jgi:flagellar basal-body rod protein FlgF
MIRGLYSAASGMLARDMQQGAIANNLANVNTSGYKKDQAVFREFPKFLKHRLNDDILLTQHGHIDFQPPVGLVGTGTTVDDIFTHFEQGQLMKTENTFDLALWGDGFFSVMTPDGERYTRSGNFTINSEGELATMEGYNVLDVNGNAITVGFNDVAVGGDGTLYSMTSDANTPFSQLKIVGFEDNRGLKKIGDNLFTTTEHSGEAELTGQPTVEVKQGYIERSNVNIVTEMVSMIEVQRAYEANQKVIQNHDALLGKAVNEVGRTM